MNFKENFVLEDRMVLIKPLTFKDFKGLNEVALDPDIWKYMPLTEIKTTEDLHEYIKKARKQRKEATRYPFVIFNKTENKIAGSTSYGNVSIIDKRLEIGWTWLGKQFQGSGINKHCKFLLLQYAFETLCFERVELKTDALNLQSRKAMLKIGAIEEGILRSHTLMNGGRRRDTIYYSILKNEWPALKETIFKDIK
ncbi:MAG: GNAT family N-acetyltransferase [Bacteroidota bacterium]|jgi:RimJ/RimL family protein N-acetyltransferase|nr:GNAT family N-acetyltransferase [Bacteroidota bacterium]